MVQKFYAKPRQPIGLTRDPSLVIAYIFSQGAGGVGNGSSDGEAVTTMRQLGSYNAVIIDRGSSGGVDRRPAWYVGDVGASGPVLHFTSNIGTETSALGIGNVERWMPISGGVTVMTRFRKTDGSNRVSVLFAIDDLSNRVDASVPYVDGTVYWNYGGIDASHRVTVAGLGGFGNMSTWTFTVGPRGMEIWQGIVKVASNANNPTVTASAAGTFFHIGGWPAAAAGADFVNYEFFYIFRRQITAEEIISYNIDPYAPFIGRPKLLLQGLDDVRARGNFLVFQ